MNTYRNIWVSLCTAALMTACGSGGDNADTSKSTSSTPTPISSGANSEDVTSGQLGTVSAPQAAACVASSTSSRTSDKVGNEKTCTLQIPERLTVKIFESTEPGCRPIVIAVAPQSDDTRAVRLVTSHNDGKKYYSSISLRNRALPDRLSGWVYYGAIDGYPKESCDKLDFKLEDVLCKRGQSLSAEYETCDNISVEPPTLFNSVNMDR